MKLVLVQALLMNPVWQSRAMKLVLALLMLCSRSRAENHPQCGQTGRYWAEFVSSLGNQEQRDTEGLSWPWSCYLGYQDAGEWEDKCIATLVTSRHVLAPASCLGRAGGR